MKKRVLLLSCAIASLLSAGAQVSLTGSNPVYTQNFNTLATSGTTNALAITGWSLNETGTNANQQYRAGDGSTNNGDTYSFGTGTNADRSLGGIASGSLTPSFGAAFQNNTGNTITAVQISYKGEQWRRAQATAGALDSLLFAYSTNATSLSDVGATWTLVPALNFTSVNTTAAGTAIALDGNTVSANISSSITVNVVSGGKLWVRWVDPNVVGNDDGLGIDDFQASFTTTGGGTPDTLVRFSPTTASVAENAGSTNISVSYLPSSPSAFTVQAVLKSGNAADINNYTTQTINFPANTATASFPVGITNNAIVDGNKTFVFALRHPSGSLLVGTDSLFTLTVTDDDAPVAGPPVYTIAQVRGTNANGGPDSLNLTCELRGTVYGVNLRANGLEFTLNDGTAGIGVFAPANSNTFGYTVNEGDSIRVWGDVTVFRGLAQIAFLDTIITAGTGNLRNPVFTNILNESTESQLTRVTGCTMLTPSQWQAGSSSSFNVDCMCGGQAVTVRIHSATTAINATPPTGSFDVIGIGSQFATTTTAPFTNGYQIVPRKLEDILYGGSISENEASSNMSIFPNPTQGRFFVNFESTSIGKANVSLKDLTGRTISSKNMNLVSGNNQIEINEELSAGIYLVSIEIGNVRAVKRVIVK